jgi:F-type H+-transporting ATPase subunit c
MSGRSPSIVSDQAQPGVGIPNPASLFSEVPMKKFLLTAFLFTLTVAAFAQGAPVAAQKSLFEGQFLAHLSLAIAAAGCGMAQGKAVAAACEGIARNPQAAGNIRTTMIIGLALIEALVIYVLVAAFAVK